MAIKPFLAEKMEIIQIYLCKDNILKWLTKGKYLERFCSNRKNTLVSLESEQNMRAEAFSAF